MRYSGLGFEYQGDRDALAWPLLRSCIRRQAICSGCAFAPTSTASNLSTGPPGSGEPVFNGLPVRRPPRFRDEPRHLLTLRGVRQAAVSGPRLSIMCATMRVDPSSRVGGSTRKMHSGYCFRPVATLRCILDTSSGAAMKFALKLFFLPGDTVANLLGATQSDDRVMIRTLLDMLFWNAVLVIVALVIFL
jgi:hypothetical protein